LKRREVQTPPHAREFDALALCAVGDEQQCNDSLIDILKYEEVPVQCTSPTIVHPSVGISFNPSHK